LKFHPNKALIFSNLENTWTELKTVYNGEFKELVFGNFPNSDEIKETLTLIKVLGSVERSNIITDNFANRNSA